jgi:hypothetical protein
MKGRIDVYDRPKAAFADLVAHTESYLDLYGPDSAKGIGDLGDDWVTSHRVMLGLVRPSTVPITLLDFGCGLSILYEVLLAEGPEDVIYSGLDVSERYIAESRKRFPGNRYYLVDVLAQDISALPEFDYVIMNGIFQYRGNRSNEEMTNYVHALIETMWAKTQVGLAFNVVTKQVDWEREDLFHAPVDPLLMFLARRVSRHIVVRHDYGLYEYTVYVYREPSDPDRLGAKPLIEPEDAAQLLDKPD